MLEVAVRTVRPDSRSSRYGSIFLSHRTPHNLVCHRLTSRLARASTGSTRALHPGYSFIMSYPPPHRAGGSKNPQHETDELASRPRQNVTRPTQPEARSSTNPTNQARELAATKSSGKRRAPQKSSEDTPSPPAPTAKRQLTSHHHEHSKSGQSSHDTGDDPEEPLPWWPSPFQVSMMPKNPKSYETLPSRLFVWKQNRTVGEREMSVDPIRTFYEKQYVF